MVIPFKEPIFVTRPLFPPIDKVYQKIDEIWTSKWLTNISTQHKKLETRLKMFLHVDNLVLFSNGTLALLIGLKALELSGEVITTPFTFPATVQALDWAGLTPVFCDINPDTLTIDAEKIELLITERTSAILGVHVFGTPCAVDAIAKIASRYHLKVIYDGAHVFGTQIKGMPIGIFGDMTMYSFHATKPFHTIEGGALTVKDSALVPTLKLMKNFGLRGPEKVVLSGINAKMNELQAGIGLEVLNVLEIEWQKRKKIKNAYIENLANIPGIRIVNDDLSKGNSFHSFVISIDEVLFGENRDTVHEILKSYNVFTRKYFCPLCSNFPWYKNLATAAPERLPIANQAAARVLAMPFYGDLGIEAVTLICNILKELYNKSKL